MQYISTRGGIEPVPFTEAVMMGLATDGGLLLPRTIPRIGSETYGEWKGLSYQELAFEVMSRFIDDIPESDLRDLIDRSYASFDSEKVVPLVHQGSLHIMELFHGPTLAFKDIALQFLGNVFEYLLEKNDSVMNILGATSGDTGSAAIYGVRGKERINIFILHPQGRVSAVQEKQMTTVTDSNVFNIAIRGTFDDGQDMHACTSAAMRMTRPQTSLCQPGILATSLQAILPSVCSLREPFGNCCWPLIPMTF
jgi:threonine synthase